MRVLVCGSRDWTNYLEIYRAMKGLVVVQRFESRPDRITIVHGAQHTLFDDGTEGGADYLAGQAAEALNCPQEPYPAEWNKYGKAAGPIRNKQMLDTGIDLILAFTTAWPPTPGTANMIAQGFKASVPVRVHVQQKEESK